MAKRLITALLGASLAVVLGATAALAGDVPTTPGEIAAARAEASQKALQQLLAPTAKAQLQASAEEGPPGEEPPDDDCLDENSPEVQALIEKLLNDSATTVATDEVIAALDAKVAEAGETFLAALQDAEDADDIAAAFDAYSAAVSTWNSEAKARIPELLDAFGELVAGYLAALEEVGACEEFIELEKEALDGGQALVDIFLEVADLIAEDLIAEATTLRDAALDDLEDDANPRPDDTLPPPSDDEPGLPDTGASALPLLFGGLALISGGSTALLLARRRRSAA